MSNWYVCVLGGDALGPVSQELLVRGVRSGKVPHDALVCRVGEEAWARLASVSELARALPGPEEFRNTEASTRYRTRGKLGEGGMGEVHLCTDGWIARDVALKVIREGEGEVEAMAAARFIREARIQGQLEHPNIVPVYDIGTRADGSVYFTMKRVNGKTLAEVIQALQAGDPEAQAAYPRRRLLSAIAQVCLTAAFAHSRGVVHRDLKPANVMLGDFGEVSVLDWGVAKVLDDVWVGSDATRVAAPPGQTQQGVLVGTPGYAAPEQARGDLASVEPRTDVYAIGAILFELLALEPLHAIGSLEEMLESTLTRTSARPSARAGRAAVPPELDDLCAQATSKRPAERPTAREMHRAIERYLDGERDAERRRELALEHVETAETLLRKAAEGGSDAEAARAEGLRELGAALALEPKSARAAETLLRVLLEPGELPAPAESALREIDRRDRAEGARVGMLFYLATCLPAPFLPLLTIRNPTVGMALSAVLGLTIGYLGWMWRTGKAEQRYMQNAVVLSFLLVALQSALFGPLLLAPAAAAATAAIFLVSIRATAFARRWILILGLGSVFGPFLLELMGVLAPSYVVANGKLLVSPNLVEFGPTSTIVILAYTAALTIMTTVLGVGRAVAALVAAERAHFAQAWRLRQLLPVGTGESGAAL